MFIEDRPVDETSLRVVTSVLSNQLQPHADVGFFKIAAGFYCGFNQTLRDRPAHAYVNVG